MNPISTSQQINEIYNVFVRPRDLKWTDTLSNDARVDSLRLMEFVVQVEDRFDIDILGSGDLEPNGTFRDFVALVDLLIQGQTQASANRSAQTNTDVANVARNIADNPATEVLAGS